MRVFDDTIQSAFYQLHEYRSEIQATLAIPEPVDPETLANFEATLAQVISEVRPHVMGGESKELQKLWHDQKVEAVADFTGRTRVWTEEGEDEFGIYKKQTHRDIKRFNVDYLIRMSHVLDRISKELGLMPQTKKAGKTGGAFS